MPKPIAIISTGNTFESIQEQEGDFHELIAEGLGANVTTIHIDACRPPVACQSPSNKEF